MYLIIELILFYIVLFMIYLRKSFGGLILCLVSSLKDCDDEGREDAAEDAEEPNLSCLSLLNFAMYSLLSFILFCVTFLIFRSINITIRQESCLKCS